ncbi:ABC transporter permease [Rhizobium sp. Root708]|uniref:ABC transporter permease n=1 Tax=Rhizobium sp. Root708 TaxID=1736592 RepID=UPI0006F7C9F8|nr:ABC transporter permease [Rhizobium sp. Root708]KRB51497.1 ABC transporter permease [Rhizobium sp. Root708]
MSPWVRALALVIIAVVAAPMFVVLPMSLSSSASLAFPPPSYTLANYVRFFSDPNWTQPLVNSLIIGVGTVCVTMLVAVPASFALVRYIFVGRGLLNLLIMLPMIVPTIVMALGYYMYFGKLHLVQSYVGVILAHSCIAMPMSTLILTAALKGFDQSVERAAMNLGASPFTTFRLITFPILRPAFSVAGLFAFIASFDEAVISLFISGRDKATLPRQMFNAVRQEADPTISAASSFLFLLVLAGICIWLAPQIIRHPERSAGSAEPNGATQPAAAAS